LHASFWRSTAACITDDAHQHAVTIPSVIQLMVTDVNVFTAVITNGKTESFAAAAQTGFNQPDVVASGDGTLLFKAQHTKSIKSLQRNAE
jgi:hypothetical protein